MPQIHTVGGLRLELQRQTNVDPSKQKLLGLKTKAGRPADDGTPVQELDLKKPVMMMGWVLVLLVIMRSWAHSSKAQRLIALLSWRMFISW